MKLFTDTLREAALQRIAENPGLEWVKKTGRFSRFFKGRGVRLEVLNELIATLGLEITIGER